MSLLNGIMYPLASTLAIVIFPNLAGSAAGLSAAMQSLIASIISAAVAATTSFGNRLRRRYYRFVSNRNRFMDGCISTTPKCASHLIGVIQRIFTIPFGKTRFTFEEDFPNEKANIYQTKGR